MKKNQKEMNITDNPLYHDTWKLLKKYRDISFRTYYRRRREAIDALSSILWGYTSKDSIEVLERFFPDCDNSE